MRTAIGERGSFIQSRHRHEVVALLLKGSEVMSEVTESISSFLAGLNGCRSRLSELSSSFLLDRPIGNDVTSVGELTIEERMSSICVAFRHRVAVALDSGWSSTNEIELIAEVCVHVDHSQARFAVVARLDEPRGRVGVGETVVSEQIFAAEDPIDAVSLLRGRIDEISQLDEVLDFLVLQL